MHVLEDSNSAASECRQRALATHPWEPALSHRAAARRSTTSSFPVCTRPCWAAVPQSLTNFSVSVEKILQILVKTFTEANLPVPKLLSFPLSLLWLISIMGQNLYLEQSPTVRFAQQKWVPNSSSYSCEMDSSPVASDWMSEMRGSDLEEIIISINWFFEKSHWFQGRLVLQMKLLVYLTLCWIRYCKLSGGGSMFSFICL